ALNRLLEPPRLARQRNPHRPEHRPQRLREPGESVFLRVKVVAFGGLAELLRELLIVRQVESGDTLDDQIYALHTRLLQVDECADDRLGLRTIWRRPRERLQICL